MDAIYFTEEHEAFRDQIRRFVAGEVRPHAEAWEEAGQIPREVFRQAIRVAAAGLVLVHNHPSGDPEPSAEDLEVTRRLRRAGRLVGVPLLDHVVVGAGVFVSLRERLW